MKFRSLLSIVLLAGVVLVGCQSGGNEAPAVSVEPVVEDTVITEEVEEEKEVAEELSIVAATVSATQVLAELGANLVGIPTTASVLPEQYAGLPEVGQAMNPDFEIVASLDADLLIMDANFKDKIEGILEAYEMDTFFFNTTTYNNFLESITQLGQV
ncbi:MAG: ABC transporter substrate-binding protein, partial [Turicibacter sp.]